MFYDKKLAVLEPLAPALTPGRCLDMFGGAGTSYTPLYRQLTKFPHFEAWEINAQRLEQYRQDHPEAILRQGDVFELASQVNEPFDTVLVDSPLAGWRSSIGMCYEHFETLPLAFSLLPEEGTVVFNVLYQPWKYEDAIWAIRRQLYYGVADAAWLPLAFCDSFYDRLASLYKFEVLDWITVHRPAVDAPHLPPHAVVGAMKVRRIIP